MKQQHIDYIRLHVSDIDEILERMDEMSVKEHRIAALAKAQISIAAVLGLLLGLDGAENPPPRLQFVTADTDAGTLNSNDIAPM